MGKFAKILVDIPVEELDQSFDYRIPEKYKDKIKIGQAVLVPFGRRRVAGFVIGITEESAVEESKIREISRLIYPDPFFDEKLLELFQWIGVYYKANLINIIKTAVPYGVISGQLKKKTLRLVKLNQPEVLIEEYIKEKGKKAYKQAELLRILLATDKDYTASELADLAGTSTNTIAILVDKGILKYEEIVQERRPFLGNELKIEPPYQATPWQKEVIREIKKQIDQAEYGTFLLHGVTGSGKTEVYLQVIDYALKKSYGAIVLVPEISLTPMMVRRFYSRFGDQIAILHSNLSAGERYDEWRRLKRGEAKIAIGARSAVFAPVNNLGLIIIDEEHENTYKQGEYPYYHSREVALKRSKITGSTVVLGSATPSLESYTLANKGVFRLLELPERIRQQALPPVELVDMREELKKGNTGIFSYQLQKALKDALDRNEQALVFLNRRGYANFLLCRECGQAVKCKNCDISLTYHAGINKLRCHYCDYTINRPLTCPHCGGNYLREYGHGTERIEEELQELFPGALIARMDLDTTSRKGAHQEILEKLEKGKIDILVGTQMIAKGHDYPNIGVVGVISADTMLNIPDFRAAERTFQLLTQVAGRTGRGEKMGQVIIQTFNPEHYSIQAARNHDFQDFYQKELEHRKLFKYPPYSLLTNIIIKGEREEQVIEAAMALAGFLKNYEKLILEILGPGEAPLAKIRNQYRWQIKLKFTAYKERNFVLTKIKEFLLANNRKDIAYNIDVDPLMMI
ncbi:MAG: primosomal protein N' [Bacillota bacterium]|nr:primosomal protein N' [Bacillota bacterium]